MADKATEHGNGTEFAGQADELGLAQERARETVDSLPDTLEVRSDAYSVMEDQVAPLRRPVMTAAIVAAAVVVVLVGVAILRRRSGGAGLPE